MPRPSPQPSAAPRLDAQSVARDALAADIKKGTKRLERLKDLIENQEAWMRKYHAEFDAITMATEAKLRLLNSLAHN